MALPGPRAFVVRHRRMLQSAAAVCVALGLFLGAQTVRELWWGDMYQANAQADLAEQLTAAVQNPALVSDAPVGVVPVAVPEGAVARIQIPKIGLDAVVVAGTDTEALKKGPGWMYDTAMPGSPGNSVISGHRSTYGEPFRRLDALTNGDEIIVSVPGHPDAVYEVRGTRLVAPGDVWVAAPSNGVRLTLTTCHPVGSDRERLIVQAEMRYGAHATEAIPADQWEFSTPT